MSVPVHTGRREEMGQRALSRELLQPSCLPTLTPQSHAIWTAGLLLPCPFAPADGARAKESLKVLEEEGNRGEALSV